MARGRPFLLPVMALAVLARGALAAQSSPFAPAEKVQVSVAALAGSSQASYQADCPIDGASLYVDRIFAGTIPRSGELAPGPHYFELDLPGYDRLGIWLSLSAGESYSIRFDPSGRAPLFADSDRVKVSAKPTLASGTAQLQIYCRAGGSLYVDKDLVGTVPRTNYLSFTLSPGSHYLELSLPGFYDLGAWLQLDEKQLYTIELDPAQITGFLDLQAEPADASILIDGAEAKAGRIELPVGEHRVEARRFGYVDSIQGATVAERQDTAFSLRLEKAAFEVGSLSFSRKAFNPRNPGASGGSALSFTATSYGSARAEIRDSEGGLVSSLNFPDIETWRQSATWNGRGLDGKVLPDGTYTATLVALPDPVFGAPPASPPAAIQSQVDLDSSLVVRPLGSLDSVPGLAYMPDPLPEPEGTIGVDAAWLVPWDDPSDSIIGLSAVLATKQALSLSLDAAAETGTSTAVAGNAADLGLSVMLSYLGDSQSPLCGAFLLLGSYSSSADPIMPGAGRYAEVSLPFSLRLAYADGAVSLGLSPGARLDFGSDKASILGIARGGLWVEVSGFRTGLSGELPISFTGGSAGAVSINWPAKAAWETKLALGSTPLVAGAILGADLQPGSRASLLAGLSLGLLF